MTLLTINTRIVLMTNYSVLIWHNVHKSVVIKWVELTLAAPWNITAFSFSFTQKLQTPLCLYFIKHISCCELQLSQSGTLGYISLLSQCLFCQEARVRSQSWEQNPGPPTWGTDASAARTNAYPQNRSIKTYMPSRDYSVWSELIGTCFHSLLYPISPLILPSLWWHCSTFLWHQLLQVARTLHCLKDYLVAPQWEYTVMYLFSLPSWQSLG